MAVTPLHHVHQRLGADLTDFAGWSMPLRYTSEVAEHHAVRRAAGVFDLSHMGEVVVSGPGSGAALDHALVGAPSSVPVGRARYSMLVDERGGVVDDLVVYRLGEEEHLVVANAGNSAVVAALLAERAEGFAAEVDDQSPRWALVAVQGPASARVVGGATREDLDGLRYYAVQRAQVAGERVWLARTGYTGEDGFEVFCDAAVAERVWDALLLVGTPLGLVPAGLASRDSLRLEAGMPLYGQELSRDVTPYDVGLGRVVRLDKEGGFVGEEALRRAAGEPATRHLVGLRGLGRRAARAGHAVLDPASGRPVGRVTSGCPSPTLGHPVAMALVDGAAPAVGDELLVDVRGRAEPVAVVALPFYSRPR